MTLQELIVKVSADISDYSKGLDKAVTKAQEAESSLAGVGLTLSAALTTPLAAIGTAALKAATDLKSASNIIRVETGAMGEKLGALNESFKAVFAEVPNGAKEVASAIAGISQRLNISGEPLEALSKQMLELANITGTQVQPIIDSVSRAFQQWSVATKDQSAELDFLFKVFQATQVPVQQLATELQQFGPTLKNFGFSFQDAALMMGALQKAGVDIESVMPGLNKALAAMAKNGIEGAAGFQAIVDGVQNGTIKMADAIAIFGTKAGGKLFREIIEGRFGFGDLKAAVESSTDTIAKAEADTKTLTEKMSEAWHKVNIAISPLGDVIKTAFNTAFAASGPLLGAIETLGSSFSHLSPAIQTSIVGLGALLAAAGPAALAIAGLELAWGKVAAVSGVATTALSSVGTAISNISFAVNNGLLAGLTAAETLLLGFGTVVAPVVGLALGFDALGTAAAKGAAKAQEGWSAVWALIVSMQANPLFSSLLGGFSFNSGGKPAPAADSSASTEASRLAKATASSTAALAANEKQAKATKAVIDSLTGSQKKAGEEANRQVTAWENMDKRYTEMARDLIEWTKKVNDEPLKWLTYDDARPILQYKQSLVDLAAVFESAHYRMQQKAKETVDITVPLYERLGAVWDVVSGKMLATGSAAAETQLKIAQMADPIKAVGDSYELLGVKSSQALQQAAADAQLAYDTIKNSATASADDIESAWLAMTKAQIDAGQNMSTEIIAQYIKLGEDALKTPSQKLLEFGKEIDRQVKHLFDGLSGEIASDIVKWQDWSDSLIKIGQDFATGMLKIFLEQLFKPLEEKIAALAVTWATKLAGMTGIFGGAASGATDAATEAGMEAATKAASDAAVNATVDAITSGAEGAAGAAGDIGGAVAGAVGSSLTGVVGAVGGVVSAISGVIGNFQMAGMNKTLDLIEKSTRYSEIYLLTLVDRINLMWASMQDAGKWRQDLMSMIQDPLAARLEEMINLQKQWLHDIWGAVYDVYGMVGSVADLLRGGASVSVSPSASSAAPSSEAAPVATQEVVDAVDETTSATEDVASEVDALATSTEDLATAIAAKDSASQSLDSTAAALSQAISDASAADTALAAAKLSGDAEAIAAASAAAVDAAKASEEALAAFKAAQEASDAAAAAVDASTKKSSKAQADAVTADAARKAAQQKADTAAQIDAIEGLVPDIEAALKEAQKQGDTVAADIARKQLDAIDQATQEIASGIAVPIEDLKAELAKIASDTSLMAANSSADLALTEQAASDKAAADQTSMSAYEQSVASGNPAAPLWLATQQAAKMAVDAALAAASNPTPESDLALKTAQMQDPVAGAMNSIAPTPASSGTWSSVKDAIARTSVVIQNNVFRSPEDIDYMLGLVQQQI